MKRAERIPTKRKARLNMGRPPKKIDQEEFEKLCALQCTKDDMCQFFDVGRRTLERWVKRTYGETFGAVFRKKREKGKISLRAAGFQLAKTSAPVWIFHAKNYLGMKDHPEDGETDIIPQPVAININVKPARKRKRK